MKKPTEQETDFANLSDEELREWLNQKYPGRITERDSGSTIVTIPVNFHRRNGRQIIKASQTNSQSDPDSNDLLASALAKAWAWQEELESGIASGAYNTLTDFAADKNIDRSYAGRLLRLTSLAPELVERILAGDEPTGISLRQLNKGVALNWCGQVIAS